MSKSCRECAHHCAIKNSTNISCTRHNVIISAENDLDCPDFAPDKNPYPTPQQMRDRMIIFCGSHNNCHGCAYWELHNTTLCTMAFTIDTIKNL